MLATQEGKSCAGQNGQTRQENLTFSRVSPSPDERARGISPAGAENPPVRTGSVATPRRNGAQADSAPDPQTTTAVKSPHRPVIAAMVRDSAEQPIRPVRFHRVGRGMPRREMLGE